ncbi:DUF6392 family protein [Pseudomonas sp. NPDC007930]|uniref:DUF6392 family protein n=1 Tax=Pseudomonas sp. NPDC007930 TaxID=3364417 RepID=UPI0036EE06A3
MARKSILEDFPHMPMATPPSKLMGALGIETLIANLGLTHKQLIENGVIPDGELFQVFEGDWHLYFELEAGLEMEFDAESEVFQSLYITLVKSTPLTVAYAGELPAPFVAGMDQRMAREWFGPSQHYSGPVRMPAPVWQTGGWELLTLPSDRFPNVTLMLNYLESLEVKMIIFSLIKPDA